MLEYGTKQDCTCCIFIPALLRSSETIVGFPVSLHLPLETYSEMATMCTYARDSLVVLFGLNVFHSKEKDWVWLEIDITLSGEATITLL